MNETMPFGKFKGQSIEEVPSSYLRWCLQNFTDLWDDSRKILEEELDERARQRKGYENRPGQAKLPSIPAGLRGAITEIIKRGYRRSALVHHPDKGGDPQMMKTMIEAHEWLQKNM